MGIMIFMGVPPPETLSLGSYVLVKRSTAAFLPLGFTYVLIVNLCLDWGEG